MTYRSIILIHHNEWIGGIAERYDRIAVYCLPTIDHRLHHHGQDDDGHRLSASRHSSGHHPDTMSIVIIIIIIIITSNLT